MSIINQSDVDTYISSIKKDLQNLESKFNYLINNFEIIKLKNYKKLSIEELFILKNSEQKFRFCPPERIDIYIDIICFYKALEYFKIPPEEL